jgi:two-component system, chemotaxis family, sensor kinase Cph1
MRAKRGDHICAIYSTHAELAETAARFLAEGLRNRERCWYVASGDEGQGVRASLAALDIDVHAELARGALNLISDDGAYLVHGAFNPEATVGVFNDAIEQAYSDGFAGFRAAAEMSWALEHEEGTYQLIVYEALLRSLFANCKAIGLCLYDRRRMPLEVINGALDTHPYTVRSSGGDCCANPFYDAAASRLSPANEAAVLAKLSRLDN